MRTVTNKKASINKNQSTGKSDKPIPQKQNPKKISKPIPKPAIQKTKPQAVIPPAISITTPPKTPNKQTQLIALLHQPQGSNLEELTKTLGWQSHSIRGIISGVLRKKLGLNVVRLTLNGACVYRILPKA